MKNPKTPDSAFSLSSLWISREPAFVSVLKELAPEPTKRHACVATVLEGIEIESYLRVRRGRGRIARTRSALVRAFVVKALVGASNTKSFRTLLLADEALRAVCGFWKEVPSESTFSRAFAGFSRQAVGDVTPAAISKALLAQAVVLDVSRDSTAITAR